MFSVLKTVVACEKERRNGKKEVERVLKSPVVEQELKIATAFIRK